MKRYVTFLIGVLFAFQATAGGKPSCSSDSYSSEVLNQKQVSENCIEYEIKVSYDGKKTFGLSHYSIAIPCGEIKNASNSENWKMVFGKDRTTGVYGLKVDDISGFGEGDSFTLKFTWCSSTSCTKELGIVSYKFGQCVSYDTLTHEDDPDPTPTCSTLLASLEKKNATCSNTTDGQLQVVIQDGQEPFAYSWSTGANTAAIQNLGAGTYSVTVKDAKGNTLTLTGQVSAPSPIVISETAVNPSCSGTNNGSIALAVDGGTGGYTFSWSNGLTGQNLNNLPSGFYTVTVSDSIGCSTNKTIVLANGAVISAEASFTRPSCTQANGGIDITPVGGAAPYKYLWSNGATTQDLQNVVAGNYLVTITDAGGCLTRKIYTLAVNNTLSIQHKVTPISCEGDTFGAIDLTISGGTSPYSVKWLDGPTTEDRTGLTIGTYQVTVTDAIGCSVTSLIGVNKKTLLVNSIVTQPTCSQSLGSITVTPTGGVEPYTYNWSTGDTDNTIDNLTPGNYTVSITDAAGCSDFQSFFIVAPTAIDATSVINNTECGDATSFSINITVSGGKSPYTYAWSNGATTEDLSGLAAGTYTVDINDAYGCHSKKQFTINPSSINWTCLINPVSTPIVCGSVGNFLSTGVADAGTYLWTVSSTDNSWSITSGSGDSSVVYTAGSAGSSATFTLAVTKNGCTQTCSYVVTGGCVVRDNTGGGDPTSSDPCTTQPTIPPVVVEEPKPEEPKPQEPIEEDSRKCAKTSIVNAYPNPFKSKVNLDWKAPSNEVVRVEIFDTQGNRLHVVYEGTVTAGKQYSFDWTAPNSKSSVYYVRYTSSKGVTYKRLVRDR